MRLDTCCLVTLPVRAEQLKSDPCLAPYTPYPLHPLCPPPPHPCQPPYPDYPPEVCQQRKGDCAAIKCAPQTKTLLAEAGPGGTCVWKSECKTDADCIVAEDCRDIGGCCSCGTVFPLEYALKEKCVLAPSEAYPPPAGCSQRCPDYCWGDAPIPPPVPQHNPACVPLENDPSLRHCVDAPATSDAYLLWQAPGGYAGTGPALELIGASRMLRAWKQSFTLQPKQTPAKADLVVTLTASQAMQIWHAFASVSFASLPHTSTPGWECYPHLHYQQSSSQKPVDLNYHFAHELLPELKLVYSLLDPLLKPSGIQPPSAYCELEM